MKLSDETVLKKGDVIVIETQSKGMVTAVVTDDTQYMLELIVPAFKNITHEFFVKVGSAKRFLIHDGYKPSPKFKNEFLEACEKSYTLNRLKIKVKY